GSAASCADCSAPDGNVAGPRLSPAASSVPRHPPASSKPPAETFRKSRLVCMPASFSFPANRRSEQYAGLATRVVGDTDTPGFLVEIHRLHVTPLAPPHLHRMPFRLEPVDPLLRESIRLDLDSVWQILMVVARRADHPLQIEKRLVDVGEDTLQHHRDDA